MSCFYTEDDKILTLQLARSTHLVGFLLPHFPLRYIGNINSCLFSASGVAEKL